MMEAEKFLPRIKFFLSYKKKIFVLVLLGAFSSVFFLISPYLSKLYIDKSFLNKDLTAFFKFTILATIVFLFSISIRFVENIIKNRISVKLRLDLAIKFIKKIYSLDLFFFQSKSTGENIYRLTNIDVVHRFITDDVPRILVDIFRFVIILAISTYLNFKLTLIMIILSPLFLFQSIYIRRKTWPIYEQVWKANARLFKRAQEAFSKIMIIKALRLESYQRNSYVKVLIENIRLSLKTFRWTVVSSLSSTFLSKAVFGIVSLYGGWLIIKGNLSLGTYTAVMIYITQLGGLIQSISSNFEYFVNQGVSLQRFFEVMNSEPKIRDLPQAEDINFLKGEILFRDVEFGYEKNKVVLRDFNFLIPAKILVGIAGPSGCGKTTLVNLILRLYEPWKGQILLDNKELREIRLQSLRDKISVATQEPLLFDLSIKENIIYGLKRVTNTEIEEVLDIVQAYDFVRQLPEGYNSIIGENACRLSQGYKQRIALARAIIREPDLLILDEATSSIDSATEEKILTALREKRQGRSTIVISHRLFSIKDADRIYFFKPDGKIEEGTHFELLAKSQFYRDFFRNQMEEDAKVLSSE